MAQTLKILKLADQTNREIYQMLQEIDSDDHGFQNSAHGLIFSEYQTWIASQFDYSQGKNLPNGWVPQTYFWFYADSHLAGLGKIRHRLTPKLEQAGGHIGYALRPSCRGQGLGTPLLELLVNQARSMGIGDILVTCALTNTASHRVIQKNGGILTASTPTVHRFLIHSPSETSRAPRASGD